MLLVFVSILLFISCNKITEDREMGRLLMNEGVIANAQSEIIMTAIKGEDSEAIENLFSKKSLSEADGFDSNDLFDFIQGDIISWEVDHGASSESIEYGKRSRMVQYSITINAIQEEYLIFVIDYDTDTINPDNEGIYMLEIIKLEDKSKMEAWQDRMRPGIYIH